MPAVPVGERTSGLWLIAVVLAGRLARLEIAISGHSGSRSIAHGRTEKPT
jgi:hypothetical protein